jgi:hypothetical protein
VVVVSCVHNWLVWVTYDSSTLSSSQCLLKISHSNSALGALCFVPLH